MFKKHIVSQILYIIVGPLCPASLKRFVFYKSDMTYDQVWLPILGICALSLTHPNCTHTAVKTWLASTLLRLLKPRLLSSREHLGCIKQIFPHRDIDILGRVWMSRFRWAWTSLNFYKEYLFGFETYVFATSGIISTHNQLVKVVPKRKQNLKPHHMTPLTYKVHINTIFCIRNLPHSAKINSETKG